MSDLKLSVWVALVIAAGCGESDPVDPADATIADVSFTRDALPIAWSDWGADCTGDTYILTSCRSATGVIGWCIPKDHGPPYGERIGRCLPACEGSVPYCPDAVACVTDVPGGERYCWPPPM